MDFILIGTDPSAIQFVRSARARNHRLIAHCDPSDKTFGSEAFAGATPIQSTDQIANFGQIDFIVLSGPMDKRADRLRKLLHSDPVDLVFSVLVDNKPDVYYEMGLWQRETGARVLPLMEELFHPALDRLEQLLATWPEAVTVGAWTMELSLPLVPGTGPTRFMNGWHWIRTLGGEIDSISSIASAEEPDEADEIAVSARMQNGQLARVRFLRTDSPAVRVQIQSGNNLLVCDLRNGFAGDAILTGHVERTPLNEQIRSAPPALRWIETWESLIANDTRDATLATVATRQIELAEAVQRSLKNQRAVTLQYDEFSEEASFKGIMATTGCGLLWGLVLIAILVAMKVPFVHHLVLPALLIFLSLQLLGLVFRRPTNVN